MKKKNDIKKNDIKKNDIKKTLLMSNKIVLSSQIVTLEQPSSLNHSIVGKLHGQRVILPSLDASRDFYNQSRYGIMLAGGKVQLSLLEAIYLDEREKISIIDGRNRILTHEQLLAVGKRSEKVFWIKYCVFKDLRIRGYIVKTALKFGADFRVYDRGIKPGDDHAKWIVFPVHESAHMTWYEFSAKNRVAHSTKKRLLIAIVDDEGEVTYYEVKWLRP